MCSPFQRWAAAPWPDCRHARLAFGLDFHGFDLSLAAGVEQHEIYESSLGLLEMLTELVEICPKAAQKTVFCPLFAHVPYLPNPASTTSRIPLTVSTRFLLREQGASLSPACPRDHPIPAQSHRSVPAS